MVKDKALVVQSLNNIETIWVRWLEVLVVWSAILPSSCGRMPGTLGLRIR